MTPDPAANQKTTGRSTLRAGIVKKEVMDAREEAQRIREAACAEAAAIGETISAEMQAAKRDGYEAGYTEGLALFNAHVLSALQYRRQVLAQTKDELLRLSVKIAEKIIGQEIDDRAQTKIDIVAKALSHAAAEPVVKIRVNPNDAALLRRSRRRLAPTDENTIFEIVGDPAIDREGCIIESPCGVIDARLEVQLRIIEQALLAIDQSENPASDEDSFSI